MFTHLKQLKHYQHPFNMYIYFKTYILYISNFPIDIYRYRISTLFFSINILEQNLGGFIPT